MPSELPSCVCKRCAALERFSCVRRVQCGDAAPMGFDIDGVDMGWCVQGWKWVHGNCTTNAAVAC